MERVCHVKKPPMNATQRPCMQVTPFPLLGPTQTKNIRLAVFTLPILSAIRSTLLLFLRCCRRSPPIKPSPLHDTKKSKRDLVSSFSLSLPSFHTLVRACTVQRRLLRAILPPRGFHGWLYSATQTYMQRVTSTLYTPGHPVLFSLTLRTHELSM